MKRSLIASAAFASALALAGIAAREGYVPVVYSDIVGVPTIGFGSTKGVRAGDRTDPVRAVQRLAQDANEHAKGIGKCIGDVPLHQHEWDAMVMLAHNVGVGAFCGSSIPRKLQAGQYEAACKTILDFRRAGGRDCSLPENKRFCGGVWASRQAEYRQCVGS